MADKPENTQPIAEGENHIQRNFILKVVDAKLAEIKKALKSQGLEVLALTEIYSENLKQET
jgi:hypothetical protein